MPSETEHAIKTALLVETATELLRGIAERQREYHDAEIKRIETLGGEIALKLFAEIDRHRAAIVRAQRYCEEIERERLEQQDTRPDNVIVRRDPTPAFGTQLPLEHTGQLPVLKPWWDRVLGSIPWQVYWAALGAGGLWAARLIAKALHVGG